MIRKHLFIYLFNELIKVAQCQNDCWDTLKKETKKKGRLYLRLVYINRAVAFSMDCSQSVKLTGRLAC